MISERYTLVKLSRRTCCSFRIREIGDILNQRAVIRVPLIVTTEPGQDGLKGLHQVVHCPTNYRVVMHPHVQVNYADCIAQS